MSKMTLKLEKSWSKHLRDEFEKPYMVSLRQFINSELEKGKTIYPSREKILSAFNLTPFNKVKVVIIGQDPYHGPSQAHGLCFSVMPGVRVPPSLVNIYKEINSDLKIAPPNHGHLVEWAKQGVLLLNAVLTVEAKRAGSHQNKGWEEFTDRIVETLNTKKENLVFVLWGAFAQKKCMGIDKNKHLVLESPHPSPFSAHRGFLGNKHFSKINRYLKKVGQTEINWAIPNL